MPKVKVTVENIVASTSFADKLDLDVIAQSLEEAYQYEQDYKSAIGTYEKLIYHHPNYENISRVKMK